MRNEALSALDGMVGNWKVTLTNAWFLESMDTKVVGSATIEWLDDAFLVLRSVFDGERDWTWLIGRSDANDQFVLLYHDQRGVCRIFDMSFEDGRWAFSRKDPDFHQRFEAMVEPDRMVGLTEASEDAGRTWRKDFDMIFERHNAGI